MDRLLDSARIFDKIICVNGRWIDYSGPALSNDGSKEVVESYPNTVLIDAPDLPQYQKRNIYFENSQGLDYLLVMDSDEFIFKLDMELFLKSLESGEQSYLVDDWIWDLRWTLDRPMRIFKDPINWRYDGRHNRLAYKGNVIYLPNQTPSIPGIEFKHDKTFRKPEMEAYNKIYNKNHPSQ